MASLVLINGAPGSGKSTIADLLADCDPVGVALDVDVIKHGLPLWGTDPTAAGLEARKLCIAQAEALLTAGYNVYLGQYLARADFIESLEDLARRTGAAFIELILVLDADELAKRLAHRAEHPERPEHEINSRLVSPDDVDDLIRACEEIQTMRPQAVRIDASADVLQTLNVVRVHLGLN